MPHEFKDFPAPWEVYSEIPCGSIHWRMGSGEDAMTEWWPKIRALTQEQRLAYRQMHPGPAEWIDWLDWAIRNLLNEKDKADIVRLVPLEVGEVVIGFSFQSPDSAQVKTAKTRAGRIEGGQIFFFQREKEAWKVQNLLTQCWTA